MKYVWVNLQTGEFSNSWNEEEHKLYGGPFTVERLLEARKNHWILLKYECLNDPDFEIYRQMKLK